MSGPMPYQLEKGPIWSVVEAALQKDAMTAYWFLEYLRDTNNPIAAGPIVTSTNLNAGPLDTTQKRADHLNEHWFGMKKDATGKWQKQMDKDWDPLTNPSLGFWINYWGDVEGIIRQTFIRAIEMSIGVGHGHTLPAGQSPTRHWPISIYLKCPTPWFEGWVTWKRWGTASDDGAVVIHFLIPGVYGSQVLKNPESGHYGTPQPIDENADNGMWLISHAHHRRVPGIVTSDPGTAGDWPFPILGHIIKDDGAIVIVNPAESDGGVLPNGRPYQPDEVRVP